MVQGPSAPIFQNPRGKRLTARAAQLMFRARAELASRDTFTPTCSVIAARRPCLSVAPASRTSRYARAMPITLHTNRQYLCGVRSVSEVENKADYTGHSRAKLTTTLTTKDVHSSGR